MTNSPARFYDAFSQRLIADYALGNPRAEAAIAFALREVPATARRILDIGCGIGWSSAEMARRLPHAEVLGIDLSPRMIELARRLFVARNLRFAVRDVCAPDDWEESPFDAIVLLDVYEHIAPAARPAFHRRLARLLAADAAVVLTCPSPAHQRHLRQHDPAGLQPVDEDIAAVELERLADDLGGAVAVRRSITVWRPDDYTQFVIRRGCPTAADARPHVLEDPAARRRAVARRLDVRVAAREVLIPRRPGNAVCLACPKLGVYSETFIRDHLVKLPLPMRVLHGNPPQMDDEGRSVVSHAARRIWRRIGARLRLADRGSNYVAAVARHLRRIAAVVVLAEYGPTGVQMLPACLRAKVPLVVHFHGYDAYEREALGPHGEKYRELFDEADAIVAVSRDMVRQLVAHGAAAEKVHYVPYYVDPAAFADARLASAEPRFLAVGRFVEKKAPQLTLLAFAGTLTACPDARLTMIGDGPLWGACRDLAAGLGIAHAVDFRGAQSHESVRQALRDCRAFVQHSVVASNGDCEGTPVALLEAQASGLPAIVTRHAGICDVVKDGETGLLVAERDVNGMAERMVALARDPELAGALGAAARRRVRAEFPYERTLGRLAEFLVEVAGGRLPFPDPHASTSGPTHTASQGEASPVEVAG